MENMTPGGPFSTLHHKGNNLMDRDDLANRIVQLHQCYSGYKIDAISYHTKIHQI